MNVQDRFSMSRRQFVASVGAAFAALGVASADGAFGATKSGGLQNTGDGGRAEVALIFCGEAGMAAGRTRLVETVITRACPRIKFTIANVRDAQQAREVVSRTAGVDGYLVWSLGRPGEAAQVFARSSRPVVLAVDSPVAGEA